MAVGSDNAHIWMRVSDQGVGIPAAAIPHLFDRFFQVDTAVNPGLRGMGIGLFIVHEIVTLHGGTIAVSSEEGAGSTFTLQFPLPAAAG
ncbi:MAG: ATP-binding protein [Herpetosiphonaceae bacterium]|nr:ATP-binding protein [Herpetosiphonaceae bacterium]